MTKKKFSHSMRVRYSEIDGQRRVYNSHYTTYVDVAFQEYSRRVFGPFYKMMLDPDNAFEVVLVRTEIDFFKPAMMDDLLHISCGLVKLGRSSFAMEYEIRRDGEEDLIAGVVKTYVTMDMKKNISCPIPPQMRQCLIDYEGWK